MAELMKGRGFLDQLSLTAALNSPGIAAADRDRLLRLAQELESLRQRWQTEINKAEAQDQNLLRRLGGQLEAAEKEFAVFDRKLL